MIKQVSRWLVDRSIILVGDGSFACIRLAHTCIQLGNPSLTVSANFPDRDPEFMRVYEIDFWQFSKFVEFAVSEARKPLLLLA